MNAVGAQLRIEGMVQGVGFRYFCYDRARRLELTGWVKNNRDGSVASLVEGDRSAVESFIEELKVGPRSALVRDVKISWLEFTGEYREFRVTF